jgi:TolB protein
MKKHYQSTHFFAFRVALSIALISIAAILITSTFALPLGGRKAAAASSPHPALPADFTYITIDVPGTTNTFIAGNNNLGQLVGGDILSDGSRHGFLDNAGVFTTIDDPNATVGTEAADINASNQIVGSYNFTDPNHPLEGAHGFLLNGAIFTPIDFPGQSVSSTTPSGINDAGDVVGVYRMNSPGNGFLFSGGVYTAVNVPAAMGCCTHATGINNAGQIVGQFKFPDDNAPTQGFLDTAGTFTTLNFPGATQTTAAGINNFGDIVGTYVSSTNQTLGFLYRGGIFFTVAFPGATKTQCLRINDSGEIVGYYNDATGALHGFKTVSCSRIAFSSDRDGNYEIYVMNPDGTGATRLTNNTAIDDFPSISPDGTKIAFESNRNGSVEIYVMNSDGTNPTRLTFSGGNTNAAFSPDGTKIVFVSTRSGGRGVWVINSDGTNETQLASFSASSGGRPHFSPDGSKIVFDWSVTVGGSSRGQIFLMNANGSNLTNITNAPIDDYDPAYSPDGSKIAFSSDGPDANSPFNLWTMNPDGTNRVNLTNDSDFDHYRDYPYYSPDGTQIVFLASFFEYNNGIYQIHVMNANGTGETNISNNTVDDADPSWGACPLATGAVSRKTHGAAGTFDVIMPLAGTSGVECRTSGGTNDYTLVVTFSGNATITGSPQAQVTSGTGCVGTGGACSGNVSVSGAVVTAPLTNIANAQVINVRINGVHIADAPPADVNVAMGFLIGDTNANRTVNAADIAQTKGRLGQAVDGTNFRSDINVNGAINAADVAIIKGHSGTSIP